MNIILTLNGGIMLSFAEAEAPLALAVLRALETHSGAPFITKAIADIESQRTKRLPAPPLTTRLCERCCMEIDLKNQLHYIRDGSYTHAVCPPQFPDSYRER